jgi:hypothetical protein
MAAVGHKQEIEVDGHKIGRMKMYEENGLQVLRTLNGGSWASIPCDSLPYPHIVENSYGNDCFCISIWLALQFIAEDEKQKNDMRDYIFSLQLAKNEMFGGGVYDAIREHDETGRRNQFADRAWKIIGAIGVKFDCKIVLSRLGTVPDFDRFIGNANSSRIIIATTSGAHWECSVVINN